ncbi:unnamed protein product, partial [marine sediment metagenome]
IVSVYINGVARLGPAVAEEVTTLPPPSKDQLNKIVKYRNPDNGVSRAYICVENSERGYQWTQMATSM